MLVLTDACTEAQGKPLIAKDCESVKFLNRLTSAESLICDAQQRLRAQRSILRGYCSFFSSSSSSSSSSHNACDDVPSTLPDYQYLVTVNMLDADAWEALELLEKESCYMMRELLDFERANHPCELVIPSSSSSESSSSSSHSFSSSSSSSNTPSVSSSSSSSNSSSSSGAPTCPPTLYIACYCPYLLDLNQVLSVAGDVGGTYGDCAYVGTVIIPLSSSSSSGPSLSSSSSSSFSSSGLPSSSSSLSSSGSGSPSSGSDGDSTLQYHTPTSTWQISMVPFGIVATKVGDPYDPRGAYEITYGPCVGTYLYIL